jgi:hypothetical protein
LEWLRVQILSGSYSYSSQKWPGLLCWIELHAWLTRTVQNDLVNGTGSGSFWNYFGKSMDAFGASEYLGPFNGHVNGACIMKELHK